VRDNADFRLAYIPDDFEIESKEPFDPEYMKALFDMGYEQARSGYAWANSPPGFTNVE
jgi:hypothetical protein